jgi:hypothetical protein
MLFSASGHLAIALAVSFVIATPLNVPATVSQRNLELVKPVSVHVDIDHDWSGEALVEEYYYTIPLHCYKMLTHN